VPFFEFRKMRFNRHLATSLRLMSPTPRVRCYTNATVDEDTPFTPSRKSPLCTVSRRTCWIFNKT
jgi:hypothetical protein